MARPIKNNSPLIRESWAPTVIVDAQKRSYFNPYMSRGGNTDAVIYRASGMERQGHTVNFPGVGKLVDPVIEGNALGKGKGEKLRVFSSELKAKRFRKITQTDTGYDRHESGFESYLNESGLRGKLTEYFRRWYDQYIFDSLQGVAERTQGANNEFRATHAIRFPFESSSVKFGYNELQKVERIAATGEGFDRSSAGTRTPLSPYSMEGMYDMHALFIDPDVKEVLRSSAGFQNIAKDADVRGMKNKLLGRAIGTVGNLIVVEMPRHKGTTTMTSAIGPYAFSDAEGTVVSSNNTGLTREDVGTEACGMRQFDSNGNWTGQSTFNSSGERWSRCILVGAQAIQVGFSQMPVLRTDSNNIDDLTEIVLETWMGAQKTKWDPEARGDYDDARVTNLDYSAIAVDVQTQA